MLGQVLNILIRCFVIDFGLHHVLLFFFSGILGVAMDTESSNYTVFFK